MADSNSTAASKGSPSKQDIRAVTDCLEEAGYALLAMRRLAIDAQQNGDDGNYLVALTELARSTFRRVDACILRLGGGPAIGNFASEFADPETDAEVA